jgi:hypothetical protein
MASRESRRTSRAAWTGTGDRTSKAEAGSTGSVPSGWIGVEVSPRRDVADETGSVAGGGAGATGPEGDAGPEGATGDADTGGFSGVHEAVRAQRAPTRITA